MRNAVICAGTMLALLLLWPVLFGGTAASTSAAAAAGSSTVTMRVPAPAPVQRSTQKKPAPSPLAPAPLAALPEVTPATESCRATLEQTKRLCAPGNDACLESASDAFDICEVRGVWPA